MTKQNRYDFAKTVWADKLFDWAAQAGVYKSKKTPDALFEVFSKFDPTSPAYKTRNADGDVEKSKMAVHGLQKRSPYKYLHWLCREVIENNIKNEDVYKITLDLEAYSQNLKRLPAEKRDIRNLSMKQLSDLMLPYILGEVQSLSDLKKAAREKINQETEFIYEGPEGRILIPKTKEAAQFWGQGTKWCVSAKEEEHNAFDEYNTQGPLVVYLPNKVVMNKDTKQNMQLKYAGHAFDTALRDFKDQAVGSFSITPSLGGRPSYEGEVRYHPSHSEYGFFEEILVDDSLATLITAAAKSDYFKDEDQGYIFFMEEGMITPHILGLDLDDKFYHKAAQQWNAKTQESNKPKINMGEFQGIDVEFVKFLPPELCTNQMVDQFITFIEDLDATTFYYLDSLPKHFHSESFILAYIKSQLKLMENMEEDSFLALMKNDNDNHGTHILDNLPYDCVTDRVFDFVFDRFLNNYQSKQDVSQHENHSCKVLKFADRLSSENEKLHEMLMLRYPFLFGPIYKDFSNSSSSMRYNENVITAAVQAIEGLGYSKDKTVQLVKEYVMQYVSSYPEKYSRNFEERIQDYIIPTYQKLAFEKLAGQEQYKKQSADFSKTDIRKQYKQKSFKF